MTAPTSTTPPDDPTTGASIALAEELRAVIELLNTAAPSLDTLTEIIAEVRLARALLEASDPQPRWYDSLRHGEGGREASRTFHNLQSPVRGKGNAVAPPIDLQPGTRPEGGAAMLGTARLGRRYEGPPHAVHGGWVAAMFDELLGVTQSLVGVGGLTARLTVRYRRPTPIGEDLQLVGWIEQDRGRAIVARATCHAAGELTADAEALFIRIDFDEMQQKMRARRDI